MLGTYRRWGLHLFALLAQHVSCPPKNTPKKNVRPNSSHEDIHDFLFFGSFLFRFTGTTEMDGCAKEPERPKTNMTRPGRQDCCHRYSILFCSYPHLYPPVWLACLLRHFLTCHVICTYILRACASPCKVKPLFSFFISPNIGDSRRQNVPCVRHRKICCLHTTPG